MLHLVFLFTDKVSWKMLPIIYPDLSNKPKLLTCYLSKMLWFTSITCFLSFAKAFGKIVWLSTGRVFLKYLFNGWCYSQIWQFKWIVLWKRQKNRNSLPQEVCCCPELWLSGSLFQKINMNTKKGKVSLKRFSNLPEKVQDCFHKVKQAKNEWRHKN